MFNSVIREKLVQELQKISLKIKKCNPEIWSEMLQSNTRSKDISTIVHDYTDSLALRSLVNTHPVNTATLTWSYWILPRRSIPRSEKKCTW